MSDPTSSKGEADSESQRELFPAPGAPQQLISDELPRAHTDDPRRTIDDLISRALAYHTGPELKELLTFTRRFPHIGPYNAMLLHIQNPGIAYALRAPVWHKKYGRRVKPGARPYVILRTMGPVAFVFDLSDTEPIDPKDDRVPELATNPFPATGAVSPRVIARLIAACLKVGIDIDLRDFATHLAGRVQRLQKGCVDFHITLNSKHTHTQQLHTLAHELAHIFCGHLGYTDQGFWDNRSNLDHAAREFEAETTANFVTDHLNLDTGSAFYLSTYVSNRKPLPEYSLDAVLKAAGKIEDMMAGTFRPKKRK
jgi:hypothetical protein